MTRIIVWTVVGIVVVLGIIFIVTTRKQASTLTMQLPTTDKAYNAFVTRYEKRAVQMTEKATNAKGAITNATPEIQAMITDLDQKMADFTASVGEMRSKTTAGEREEAIKKVQALYRDIRKLIRNLGGTVGTTTEEGEGGE